jgi:XapX domain-containing protein
MVKMIYGLLLGFILGGVCRLFKIPVPAPSNLIGALLVLTLTSGYLLSWYIFH